MVEDRRLTVGRYLVEVDHDHDCPDPAGEDGFPPIVVFDGHYKTLGHYALNVRSPLYPLFDKNAYWVWKHRAKICEILGLSLEHEEAAAALNKQEMPWLTKLEHFAQGVENILLEMKVDTWTSAQDYFDALAALWKLRGETAYIETVHGPCSGDRILCLGIYTLGYANSIDRRTRPSPHDRKKDLSFAMRQHAAWVYGDCWEYHISDLTQPGENSYLTGCGGYIGSPNGIDPAREGDWDVLEASMEALSEIIAKRLGTPYSGKVKHGRWSMYRIACLFKGEVYNLLLSPNDEILLVPQLPEDGRLTVKADNPQRLGDYLVKLKGMAPSLPEAFKLYLECA
jgi:hypothetical protein